MKKRIKNFSLPIIGCAAVITFLIGACVVPEEEVDNSKYYFDPPTGIQATLLSDDRTVNLTWNAVPNAGGYEINFRTNLDSGDTRRYLSKPTNPSYQHSYYYYWINYTDVTTIYYYIKTHPSKSGYIASDWSEPVSVKIR